ncbi:MFS transporter [Streptomyces sp. URMC 127]|uniref:MFS transporter n=1 Tax=Streptomyces sp. URMC 127 TaxID=3423402 RepID=UPI003F1965FD
MGKRYYLLLCAYLTSSLGNWVYRITLPLLVLHQTGSALSTSLVYVVEYVPFLLFSLPGGVWADRWNRRRILISGDLSAAAIAAALAVLVISGVDRLWPILVLALLLGCVEPVYHPAFQSFLPDITAKENLARANGWLQSGDNIMGMLGPVVAGGAIALFGYEATVTFNAVSFFVSAGAILLMGDVASPRPANAAKTSFRKDIGEAGRYIFKKNRLLLAGSLLFTGTNFATWIIQANFVFYLTSYRHFSPSVLGAVVASQGVGAVLGAAVAGRLNKRFPAGGIIIATTAVAGCATLALLPLRHPVLIGAAWGLLFACASVNMVSWFTLRQKIVPARLLGRVVATTRMLAFASIPLAALVGGAIENSLHDIYVIIVVSGVVRLCLAGFAWFSPMRNGNPAPARSGEGLSPSPPAEQAS